MENNDYYEEITSQKFDELAYYSSIDLSERDIKFIESNINFRLSNYENFSLKTVTVTNGHAIIFSLKDEWYIVKCDVIPEKVRSHRTLCYKCDQFDGLVEFFKDKKEIMLAKK